MTQESMEAFGVIDFAQTVLRKNKALFGAAAAPLRSHGPDHHERVYRYALKLAETMGVSYDPEVLAAAALLHDLAAYYPDEVGEAYHDHDFLFAEQAMRELGMSDEKIAAASEAIKAHGSDAKYRRDDESVETQLLRDADKLDVFGPLGCARIIMVRALKGDTLQQIVDDFWTQGHLKRKWESISFPEAREMAQADYAYSQEFFKRLALSLETSL